MIVSVEGSEPVLCSDFQSLQNKRTGHSFEKTAAVRLALVSKEVRENVK